MAFNKISVIGLGYIGLPTAAMFASKGCQVVGVDINVSTVETINKGLIHIVEPGLEAVVKSAVENGYLRATTQVEASDAFLIAVPTPFTNTDGEIPDPDLSYIKQAADSIATVLEKGDLVVLESTSPVGATEKLTRWLANARPDLSFPLSGEKDIDVSIAHCPERVLPGHVMKELVYNDRVIGGMTQKCSEKAIELYNLFVKGSCVLTNARTAEMAKLTENACRDVQIAFANELSTICDNLNIDVWELISLANRHPRINILQPGPGVGGHCIAVDPWFIVSKTPELAKLIHTARLVNDSKPGWVVDKTKVAITDFLLANPTKTTKDITIACYGLTFKPDIDDLRESPALEICKNISNFHSGRVLGVEPNIDSLPFSECKFELVDKQLASDIADIHVLLVDHSDFNGMNMAGRMLVDTKGVWTAKV